MCDFPIKVKVSKAAIRWAIGYQDVPCRKCFKCIRRRTNDWVIRLTEELKVSSSAFFVTLTYSDENLIYGDLAATLCREHLKKYIRKVRKKCGKNIKYYACGEYGTKTKRPHYHVILFNASRGAAEYSWSDNGEMKGHVKIGNVTQSSMAYVAKYINKASYEFAKNAGVEPEYSVMSKNLGVGYLKKHIVEWHRDDPESRLIYVLKGRKYPLPSYYKKKIFTEEELIEINHSLKKRIKNERRKKFQQWKARNAVLYQTSGKWAYIDKLNSERRSRAKRLRAEPHSHRTGV